MSIVDGIILRAIGGMSCQQREDFYLTLACMASDHGDEQEATIWLWHAEERTTYQGLVNWKEEYDRND